MEDVAGIQQLLKRVIAEMHIEDCKFDVLGKGHDGIVYKANDEYCIKVRNISSLGVKLDYKESPNLCFPICSIYSEKGNLVAIVQRFVDGYSLQKEIKTGIKHSESDTLSIIHDLLSGLNVLHSQGIVHRDFHPGNVLLDSVNGRKRAVIIDFDEIKPYGDAVEPCFRYNGYQAPEIVLTNTSYDNKSEVFSVGVMMWELLYGDCQFGGYNYFGKVIEHSWQEYENNSDYYNEQVKRAICRLPNEMESVSMLSADTAALLLSLLNPNRNNRVSAEEALRSSLFE